MLLKMGRMCTCDAVLLREVGCTLPGIAVEGCCREWEGWTFRTNQKTRLSRAGHRRPPSAAWPSSGWGHPPAKCTGQESERVPNTGTGAYFSLAMSTAHADGLGFVALMTGCPAELASGRLRAHLDFFDATGKTAQLASGILGTFPLL